MSSLHAPKPGTCFAVHRGRLALFHRVEAHRDYWRGYWTDAKLERMRRHRRTGDLGEFAPVFERYLPRHGRVLEAGCGAGFYVAALLARGYDVVGIDYEPRVVERLVEIEPGLPVEVGDIRRTRFADGEIAAYISLGVVEHFEDGCDDALAEMVRILAPGGLAFVSVPYLNPRRARHLAADRPPSSDSLAIDRSFHQYYFAAADLRALVERHGFETLDLFPYGCEAFLVREHPLVRALWRSPLARDRVKARVRPLLGTRSRPFRHRFGHMILGVFRKR